jgi:hypothetical protein
MSKSSQQRQIQTDPYQTDRSGAKDHFDSLPPLDEFLAGDAVRGPGNRFEPLLVDAVATIRALAVAAVVDLAECSLDKFQA